MRETSYNSFQFAPGDPGNITQVADLLRYVQDLEQRLASALSALASGHKDMVFAIPNKPRTGDLIYASSGLLGAEGWYYYNSGGVWTLLG